MTRGRATAGAVIVALMLGPACSGGDPECGDGDDCPHLVSHGGREYQVSCAVVPRRLAGEPLDVTDEQERDFGPGYGVDGYELKGADPDEAIVLEFAQRECGDEALHVGFAEDLGAERLREIGRLLRR